VKGGRATGKVIKMKNEVAHARYFETVICGHGD
jgi:hypothetical protein